MIIYIIYYNDCHKVGEILCFDLARKKPYAFFGVLASLQKICPFASQAGNELT